MTVITAILGFYADLSRRQRWAVAHILSMRGKVNYSFEPDAEELRRRDLLAMQAAHQGIVAPEYRDRPSAPKWLVDLCGLDLFATVSVVSLAGTMDEARQERGTP